MKQRVCSAIVLLTITVGCILASEISRILFFAAAGILQHDQAVIAAGDLLHGFQKIIGVLLRHLPDDNG